MNSIDAADVAAVAAAKADVDAAAAGVDAVVLCRHLRLIAAGADWGVVLKEDVVRSFDSVASLV